MFFVSSLEHRGKRKIQNFMPMNYAITKNTQNWFQKKLNFTNSCEHMIVTSGKKYEEQQLILSEAC